MNATVLVTGGAGYIGSHACVALLESGCSVVVLDNLCASKRAALERVEQIAGRPLVFCQGDLRDREIIENLVAEHEPSAVIHFAGLKAVGESVEQPLRYWQNNVGGSAVLLGVLAEAGVRNFVFSSSCTVYGFAQSSPITEEAPLQAVNPYGQTKLAIENMLRDLHAADPSWNISILRYFNPVGAHPSGAIGEDPLGIPNNLMPFITQVAVGRLQRLSVFGGDYETVDGTCIRDYIHVMDLVDGHLRALEWLSGNPGLSAHNLGTGRGFSVLEVIQAFERATGIEIPYAIVGRRAGDAPSVFADPSRAQAELGWKAERDLDAMCGDAWNWQKQNPEGY
ncbi:MAG: UDP-glucose 4-epimerase GalE [Xanthomonadales bacterium]|nr:UDP-glucose 4-epimerase GalE [Xanthomonadales bacterium]